ncbi:hypothetical protein DL93DRAFT_2090191 [Clavulina sp. PMI_390]|nr:hypothetical protein DL93DRAFT_2090191 [Clavulina sp. PMI_390]
MRDISCIRWRLAIGGARVCPLPKCSPFASPPYFDSFRRVNEPEDLQADEYVHNS